MLDPVFGEQRARQANPERIANGNQFQVNNFRRG
jgi:hypothetical protein